MPKRERKRPKAVRAWASYNDSGAIRESRTFPRRRICDCYWGRSSTQRVIIVPEEGEMIPTYDEVVADNRALRKAVNRLQSELLAALAEVPNSEITSLRARVAEMEKRAAAVRLLFEEATRTIHYDRWLEVVAERDALKQWATGSEAVRVAAERIPTYTGASKSVLDTLRLALSACPPLESVTGKEAER